MLPPDWALGPWNDAVHGEDEVRRVAALLREREIPSSAIWTEDWKGHEETSLGFRLSSSWELNTDLYPDAAALSEELEDDGFKWLGYFSPFIEEDSPEWVELGSDMMPIGITGMARQGTCSNKARVIRVKTFARVAPP